jgi:predicted sulfurtransferase
MGGIRCEKATSYAMQSNLFPKNMPIYHLEGGILAYLDHVSKEKEDTKVNGGSTFHSECFVFDKRVAVAELYSVLWV